MYSEDDCLALSGLQHLAYCERQWALIHVEQCWEDNGDTARGDAFHARVDTRGYSTVRGFRSERRVHLINHDLGLYGVADIVEYGVAGNAGLVRPVEYKVGKPKLQDWDRVQVAAQSMCLEGMLDKDIDEAFVFYGETRRRESVAITDALRKRVCELAKRMHELFEQGVTPPPLQEPKCRRCSLSDSCAASTGSLSARGYWRRAGIALEEIRI